MSKKVISIKDILLIAVISLCCLAGGLVLRSRDGNLTATVTVNGSCVHSVKLSEVGKPYTFTTDTTPKTVILIERDGVSFESSDCENQLCVGAGKLTASGTTAVCLPARVVLTLNADSKNIDAITW